MAYEGSSDLLLWAIFLRQLMFRSFSSAVCTSHPTQCYNWSQDFTAVDVYDVDVDSNDGANGDNGDAGCSSRGGINDGDE